MAFILKFYQGKEVLDKTNHEKFIADWEKLINKQQKISVFQSHSFVYTWYNCYFESYSPLLLLAKDGEGQLLGLLPLAVHRKNNTVVCAGDELAEYHGFIADPVYEEAFGIACLIELKNKFSFKQWRLGWLAPESNTAWINEGKLAKHGIHFQLEEVSDPVWNLLDQAKLRKIKKRSNVKRCYRQYAQRGNFRYERIVGKKRMETLLETFARQMDFKKEALFNRRLFNTDPHIRDFLTALQAFPEMNHFSVLWLNDKPIAYNHGYVDNGEICLAGYTSYDPSESRNSPGKLHLIELAKASTEEGLERIDLTPGKDAYKERFANDSREAKKVTFYFNNRSKLMGQAKQALKEGGFRLFAKMGIDDQELKFRITDIGAYVKRLRHSGFMGLFYLIQSFLRRKHAYKVFRVKESSEQEKEKFLDYSYEIKRNDFSVLVHYHEPKYYVSRKTLFQKALTRFSRGDKLYTLSYQGKLVYLAWLREKKYELKLPGAKYRHQFPENSRIIYAFCGFGDTIEQEIVDAFYDKMIADCLLDGITDVYICFGKQDQASEAFQERRGFHKYFEHVHTQTLYFFHKASHVEYPDKAE